MRITINSSINPCDDHTITTEEGKYLKHPKGQMFPLQWDQSDIAELLTEKQFDDFLNGKYEFNIPTWKVRLINMERSTKTRDELLFISKFM